MRKLYAFGPASTWPALAPFIAGKPDDKLIAAQWGDVLRLTASVRTGTVSASLLLKRLGAYPRQNGPAWAEPMTGQDLASSKNGPLADAGPLPCPA